MKGSVAIRFVVLLAALFLVQRTVTADTFQRIGESRAGAAFAGLGGEPELPRQTVFETLPDQYWVIQVTKTGGGTYCILFGPDPSIPGARGRAIIRDCTYPLALGHQELAVIEGVSYYAGTQPYGGTQGGSGYSEGTKFIAFGRSGSGGGDDVFILEGLSSAYPLRVYPAGNPDPAKSKPISTVGHYLEVPDNGYLVGKAAQPVPVAATDPIATMRAKTQVLVARAIADHFGCLDSP